MCALFYQSFTCFYDINLYRKASKEGWAKFYTVIKLSRHLKPFEKFYNHSPLAHYYNISVVFSNVCWVWSQYKTWLSLLYLLNK
jgi:hypothetical protein